MAKVDNNMNMSSLNNKNETLKDIEKGKKKSDSEGTPWCKIITFLIAIVVLVGACGAAAYIQDWVTSLIVFIVLGAIYVLLYYYRWIYVAIVTAPRDLKAIYGYVNILMATRSFSVKNMGLNEIFHERVKKHPNKACFLFEDETWTFKMVEDYSLRVTSVMKSQGFKRGDTIGIMMINCPEMPSTWLGIVRFGGITPLINTNQTGNTLIHSLKVVDCNAVIYGEEYEDTIQGIKSEVGDSIKFFKTRRIPQSPTKEESVNVATSDNDFAAMVQGATAEQWARTDVGFHSKSLYIYTSGTTGLPKAAVITPSRFVFMGTGIHYMASLRNDDVIYCPMPLYHSAGGCITMGQAFVFGCTIALRNKFSASQYFTDCIKYNATAAHYIGEMCRYILSTPVKPTDKQHKVRIVYGNGMRPIVWKEFVERFNIKKVGEFYGATEGNANIVNNDNKMGAVGFVSRIIPVIYPIAIIKVDEATGEPIRNSKGLCQLTKPNEPGVFIGKITPSNPARAFLGYADKSATDKKIVRDVFTKGDSAFISGDILIADEYGYLFFRDRTGDTFRWRGENVSTSEVEAVISKASDQKDAVVYGVEVPNTEGRAGMCGIVDPEGTVDLEQLAKNIAKDLPSYARPIFIRIMATVEMTGTFKMRKVDLQKEGFNPTIIKDKLYYLDMKLGKYLPLGEEEYEHINLGKIRL